MATIEQGEQLTRQSWEQMGRGLREFVRAMLRAVRSINRRRRGHRLPAGKITRKELAQLGGAQEVISLESRRARNLVVRELEKAGIPFALSRDSENKCVLHVRASDSGVVGHALQESTARITKEDARKRARSRVQLELRQRAKAKMQTRSGPTPKVSQRRAR